MQASFLVWPADDAYRLALAADLEAATLKRLQMFTLRSRVRLASLSATRLLLGLAGPQAAEALADAGLPCPAAAMTVAAGDTAQVLALDAGRYVLAVAPQDVAELWHRLSLKARPAGVPAWRWLDVQAGFPLVTAATKEEFVPQMADFEKIGGVSFHKGCYPGQEVVARTQYLGQGQTSPLPRPQRPDAGRGNRPAFPGQSGPVAAARSSVAHPRLPAATKAWRSCSRISPATSVSARATARGSRQLR